jgi:hypothetical protein
MVYWKNVTNYLIIKVKMSEYVCVCASVTVCELVFKLFEAVALHLQVSKAINCVLCV